MVIMRVKKNLRINNLKRLDFFGVLCVEKEEEKEGRGGQKIINVMLKNTFQLCYYLVQWRTAERCTSWILIVKDF